MRVILLFSSLLFSSVVLAQADTGHVYLFSYFKNNGKDGLHLAYSYDGFRFTALKKDSSFLRPVLSRDSLMRDPCIIRGADGGFHMVWTVSWNDRGIGYASSTDLVNWSEQVYIPVMGDEDSARNCWAPEITYDPKKKEYMIYWATTISGLYPSDTAVERGYNHRIYYTTTKNFKKFSKTRMLYNQGFNVIDASIVHDGSQYVMFLKDETRYPPQKNIRVATSSKLTEGFGNPSMPITGNYWAEGPTAIKIGDHWIVYFDKYRDHKYGAVASSDLVHWEDLSDKIRMPAGIRHGSILPITKAELAVLIR
jgi:beta-xylosidase